MPMILEVTKGTERLCRIRKCSAGLFKLKKLKIFFFYFLGLYLWHSEVPRLGVESEL